MEMMRPIPRSFDIIGSREKAVAIVEIPRALRDFEGEVAKRIMERHKNVKSVLVKESERLGESRIRRYRVLAGDQNTEVIHREAGCLFKLDPQKVYFSPREGTERGRVAEKVRDGEEILVMFSGVGPYPIVIAKRHEKVKVIAIESNPDAHKYCLENIYLNRVQDKVIALLGDVRDICPKLGTTFDRIVMPLPKGAHQFLDLAIPLLNCGGTIHFYHWAREPDLFSQAEELLSNASERFGRRAEFLEEVRVSQYSPRIWKIRVDARIHC
ncbi:class I SAM-dependent methyltransferase family protein [Candidatus Bathyarchaeota archaeon]|nr:class I SAM-dependent methyltransferase family protein [Candidatus Bathyarchaeota archaeon]